MITFTFLTCLYVFSGSWLLKSMTMKKVHLPVTILFFHEHFSQCVAF
ncbi:hypothetical protein M153_4890002869 [Pseudoloma neurophilia]|uniref:Uncharacterized protein n=1 Tax=Pseudoloma neurophilia TaxID=146866 RepID=A0A0R0M4W2_9MICR|nr:hypothetical protein M153_4890002869 [Pseudoloma neurophilia]